MKRFAVITIFALGMISLSAPAETNHATDPSQLKRAVADPYRTDFGSRANSIVGACDTSRAGTADTAAAGGDLFQAQLPSGSVGDLSSGGSTAASPLGGAPAAAGAGGGANVAQGMALFNSRCTSCHNQPPDAVIAVLQGKQLSGRAAANGKMVAALAGLSDADKQSIIAYQKTL